MRSRSGVSKGTVLAGCTLLLLAAVAVGAPVNDQQDDPVTALDEAIAGFDEPPADMDLPSWDRSPGRHAQGGRLSVAESVTRALRSDPRIEGLRAVPLGPNSTKYLYDPVVGDVRLISSVENKGPGYMRYLDFYTLYPINQDRQEIADIEFHPDGGAFIKDNRGQSVVYYHFTDVRAGTKHLTWWRARATTWSLRYEIDPNDVGPLTEIPEAIRTEFLADDPLFQIMHPTVTAARDAALRGEKHPLQMARKIFDWVQSHLTYVAEEGWDDAVTVIKRGNGSCSEYSFAFIAICRSAGIPARWVGSMVRRGVAEGPGPFRDDPHHRWAQVYLPRIGWVHCNVQGGTWGYLSNAFLITSLSSGPSDYLSLRYDSYRRWSSTGGTVGTNTERYGLWYSHLDSYYPLRAESGQVWSSQGQGRILWDILGETEGAGRELTLKLSRMGKTLLTMEHINPNDKAVTISTAAIDASGPYLAATLHRSDKPALAGYLPSLEIKDDMDGDKLDDQWEAATWAGVAQNGGGDLDVDGASNLCEYYGMTDPMCQTLFASDQPALHAEVGRGSVGYNQYGCGDLTGKIVVNGITWDKSLGAHAASQIEYEVPPGVSAFHTLYGLEDHGAGSAVFECYVNDDLVFTSHRLKKGQAQWSQPHRLQVPVSPGDRLVLVVNPCFNKDGDHSCWLQPAFTYELLDVAPPPATVEDFESRGFVSFSWRHEGDSPWFVASDQRHGGSYSARAGEIDNDQISTLKITRTCQADKISFYVKVSCEMNFDRLVFSVDGKTVYEWSGNVDWKQVSHPVAAGNHTFEWSYVKDSSGAGGQDTAWIDDITFPAQ